jgi:hypothetical protein
MSIRLSVCIEQLDFQWTDFHEIWYLRIFWQYVGKFRVTLKSDKNRGYFTWRVLYIKTNIHFLSYLAHFFLEWEIFQTKVVEKIKKHILCSATFFSKIVSLWDDVEKYCRAGQATDDNMANAHYMLDTQGYKYTQMLRSIHCFSTAKMVTRTRLNITLYVRCLSCYLILPPAHKIPVDLSLWIIQLKLHTIHFISQCATSRIHTSI